MRLDGVEQAGKELLQMVFRIPPQYIPIYAWVLMYPFYSGARLDFYQWSIKHQTHQLGYCEQEALYNTSQTRVNLYILVYFPSLDVCICGFLLESELFCINMELGLILYRVSSAWMSIYLKTIQTGGGIWRLGRCFFFWLWLFGLYSKPFQWVALPIKALLWQTTEWAY